jgi:chromatin segregation and condensation protein Rec8/ScpA/Scc1 (kleisin family)
MKTYPYHTPEGIIQLVEKRELDQLLERLAKAEELIREIRDDEVNAQDETDKFLRDHKPSELAKMRADNAELLERLAEARESHIIATARKVQTIQQQAVEIDRLKNILNHGQH